VQPYNKRLLKSGVRINWTEEKLYLTSALRMYNKYRIHSERKKIHYTVIWCE